MVICRNAERVHGKKKVGNPCSSTIGGGARALVWKLKTAIS